MDAVWALCEPFASQLGLSIWDVRFQKEGGDYFLRVFIEKEGGVTIEDCEAMSRAIDAPLDELDAIEQSYCLEVSSPGLERELVRPEHFEAYLGCPVMVRLIRPDASGRRELKGTLAGYEAGMVSLLPAGEEQPVMIAKKDTVFVKADDFDEDFGGLES